jgi:hypothetical protein
MHCFAHKLNLALLDTCRQEKESSYFLAVLQSLYSFMSSSIPHALFRKVQLLLHPHQKVKELKRLSDTRWSCRAAAIEAVKSTFPAILMTLGQLSHEADADRMTCARGLLAQLDFNFAGRLVIYSELFGATNVLSKALQDSRLPLAAAAQLVQATITTITSLPEMFDSLYAEAEKICEELAVDLELAASVRHRTKRQEGEGKATLKAEMVAACGRMAAEMTTRFLGPDHPVVFAGVDALCPGSETFLEVSPVLKFADFYHLTTGREKPLKHQLKSLKDLIAESKRPPETQLDLLDFVTGFYGAFNLVAKVLMVALTIPAASASAERSFSALKRIKTHLRTTMTDERLSNITLLSVHNARAKTLDEDRIIDSFASLAKRRNQLTF